MLARHTGLGRRSSPKGRCWMSFQLRHRGRAHRTGSVRVRVLPLFVRAVWRARRRWWLFSSHREVQTEDREREAWLGDCRCCQWRHPIVETCIIFGVEDTEVVGASDSLGCVHRL